MKYFVFIALSIIYIGQTKSQTLYTKRLMLLGSRFEISVIAKDSIQANNFFNIAINEVNRIDHLISEWKPESQTSAINQNAGISPIKIDIELFELIERSKLISEITDGAFDITWASVDQLWRFDGSMNALPDSNLINKLQKLIDYKNIILDRKDTSVFLKSIGMKIGMGGIGQGYAAEQVVKILKENGAISGIVNVSGDIKTWGFNTEGKEWTIAITNPFDKAKTFGTFNISNSSVVTSGNYEKYTLIDGKKYAHIINPKTGYPTQGVVSATVFAQNTEIADALATALFVLGPEIGIDRVNQIKDVECLIVDDKGNVLTSKNLKISSYEK